MKKHCYITSISFFVVAFTLYAMEDNSYLNYQTFLTNNTKYPSIILQQVDTHYLTQEDKQFFTDLAGNFTDLKEMFGLSIAVMIKGIHTIKPETLFDILQASEKERTCKMPEGQKYFYNWMIKNADTYTPIGTLSLATYTDPLPTTEYTDKLLLELGLILDPLYRNQGLASHFASHIVTWLQNAPQFKQATFCFNTLPTNKGTHRLAEKLNYQHLVTRSYELDFGLFKKTITSDLFFIPKQ
ncbi:MAG TPA: GNAT family N-acetyltransferase [Candidatus Babeliales bacterium]|nr:GNAT family N-acetyltransferase [Candidatus Babeliales bacterium]